MYKLNVKQLEKTIKDKTHETVTSGKDRRIALGSGLSMRIKPNKACLWLHRYYYGNNVRHTLCTRNAWP